MERQKWEHRIRVGDFEQMQGWIEDEVAEAGSLLQFLRDELNSGARVYVMFFKRPLLQALWCKIKQLWCRLSGLRGYGAKPILL